MSGSVSTLIATVAKLFSDNGVAAVVYVKTRNNSKRRTIGFNR